MKGVYGLLLIGAAATSNTVSKSTDMVTYTAR
jgi:hypothetical protein